MIVNLRTMGSRCKTYRVGQGYKQLDIARDTGYSIENISAFECGRNDNARILLWYLTHGMTVNFLYNDEVSHGEEV